VRVRTLFSFASGAAFGAAWMYLADPEHGPARRREARRNALRQARQGAVVLATDARRRAEQFAFAAVAGYQQGRVEGRPEGDDALPSLRAVEDRRAG
jgi:hypothetical protein